MTDFETSALIYSRIRCAQAQQDSGSRMGFRGDSVYSPCTENMGPRLESKRDDAVELAGDAHDRAHLSLLRREHGQHSYAPSQHRPAMTELSKKACRRASFVHVLNFRAIALAY